MLAASIAFTPVLVLAAETEKVEESATLSVETVPGSVEIKVNSETIGFAPIHDLALPPGEYVISASFIGREPVGKNVVLGAGKTTDIHFYLSNGNLKGESWFSRRDFLLGFALFCGVVGFTLLIGFSTMDLGY